MQNNRTHLPSVLILSALGLSALSLLGVAVIMGGMSVASLINAVPDPATEMINAAVFGFEGVMIFACAWFVLQKTLQREQAEQPIQLPFAEWYTPAVFAVVLPALALGGVVAYQEIPFLSWSILPLLTIIVIGLPVWLLLGMGSRGIDLGARWRFFGVLGLGMTVSPFLMIFLEIVVLGAAVAFAAVFIAMQPALMDEVTNLGTLITFQTSEDALMQTLAPYLVKPGVIAGMLFYVAVCVPLIEELFKPLAVWLFAGSLETPAQGFALGLASGAAFGLIESLNAGADGSPTWAVIVSVRAGTTLLHIAASGLVGWGIAVMFKQRKFGSFAAAYLGAVTVHGLWNACALIAGLSSISYLVNDADWLFAWTPAALGGMATLGIGMFILLINANRKLRSVSAV